MSINNFKIRILCILRAEWSYSWKKKKHNPKWFYHKICKLESKLYLSHLQAHQKGTNDKVLGEKSGSKDRLNFFRFIQIGWGQNYAGGIQSIFNVILIVEQVSLPRMLELQIKLLPQLKFNFWVFKLYFFQTWTWFFNQEKSNVQINCIGLNHIRWRT